MGMLTYDPLKIATRARGIMPTTTHTQLTALRQLMQSHHLDFYLSPTRDEHNNEYVPAHWQRRDFISGFTGSYGQALIGLDHAYLWTDPRYFLQAENELDPTHFQLMKQMQAQAAPISTWLCENAKNKVIGVDPKLMSIRERDVWSSQLRTVNSELKSVSENLIDHVWQNKPAAVYSELMVYPDQFAGLSAREKIQRIQTDMATKSVDALIITMLDEIAWVFNIRGNDIPFNPLLIAYAIITKDNAVLFTSQDRVNDSARAYLQSQHIQLNDYEQFASALSQQKGMVWVDPTTASCWVADQLQAATLYQAPSPIVLMKAIKNKTELTGAFEAHRLDGLALCKFFFWLEKHWHNQTEVSAAEQLARYRFKETRCKDLSFTTICGYADHGAIVHYRPEKSTAHTIKDDNLLLVDSGGQYFEGTTDVTRTIHLGKPTDIQKTHYTLVLKGHLALRHSVFPDGTCGEHLNAFARLPLWQHGLDFGHGTGHGVGAYLCVHEGPQRISSGASNVPLKPGMIVSNEPGVYLTGQYGIRIENLCAVREVMSQRDSLSGDGPFYSFDDLTLFPYARNLIDKSLLSAEEIRWIDEYHRTVNDALSADLPLDVAEWLRTITLPL